MVRRGSVLPLDPQDCPPSAKLAEHSRTSSRFLSRLSVPGARRGWVRQRLKQLRLGVITYVALSTPASCPLNPPSISYLLRFTFQL